ncbi:MAG: hypothetical protein V4697_02935 [Patescibacteria group bacterium]
MNANLVAVEKHGTEAPDLKPFSNPISWLVIIVILSLFIFGGMFTFAGFWSGRMLFWFPGIIMCIVAGLMLAYGRIDHPAGEEKGEPRTGGIISFWGSPIKIDGKFEVVGGKTILANYFPFYFGTIKIDMSNKDKLFPMTILTEEDPIQVNGKTERLRIPMKGTVSLTLRANEKDPVDFVQAGNNMDAVFEQLKDIVTRETQNIAKTWSAERIQTEAKEFSKALEDAVRKRYLEGGSFGIIIIKAQGTFSIPEEILAEMIATANEFQQRKTQLLELETNAIAAEAILQRDRKHSGQMTYDDCLQEVKHQWLIKGNFVRRVEVSGGGRVFLNADDLFQEGGDRKKKGK